MLTRKDRKKRNGQNASVLADSALAVQLMGRDLTTHLVGSGPTGKGFDSPAVHQ